MTASSHPEQKRAGREIDPGRLASFSSNASLFALQRFC